MAATRQICPCVELIARHLRSGDSACTTGMSGTDHALLLQQQFPLLLPEGTGGVLHGFLQVRGQDYRVRFEPARHSPRMQDGHVEGGNGGSATLHGCAALWAALKSVGALPILAQVC